MFIVFIFLESLLQNSWNANTNYYLEMGIQLILKEPELLTWIIQSFKTVFLCEFQIRAGLFRQQKKFVRMSLKSSLRERTK